MYVTRSAAPKTPCTIGMAYWHGTCYCNKRAWCVVLGSCKDRAMIGDLGTTH